MKNGKRTFWILNSVHGFLVLTDGLLTYLGTPDLTYEANPLVSVFGLGWGALFTVNVMVFSLCIVLSYYNYVKYKRPEIPYEGYCEYSSMLFYGRPDRFRWSFYKLPKYWKPVFAASGYALGIALPADRFIIDFQWVLFLTDSPIERIYNPFRSLFPWGRFDVVFATVLLIVLVIRWTFKECKLNRLELIRQKEQKISGQIKPLEENKLLWR
ncbi:MAG: hypothetical protein LBR76_08450 [Oscillospiraceae bacterium]|jgi:hypothetical protein|nr:hypothetical protein [Oscillospiraceae bacterium]